MTEMQEERFVSALESIADSLRLWVTKTFPQRKEATDATITHIPTDEDRLREEQGDSPGEPIEQWIGLRERAISEEAEQDNEEVPH